MKVAHNSNLNLQEQLERKTRGLKEAWEQQAATAALLQVIGSSTFDLQAVLDTLVESAVRLCEADMGAIARQAGDAYRQVASFGFPSDYKEFMSRKPIPMGRGSVSGRVVLEKKVVHIPDVRVDPDYAFQDVEKFIIRTLLGVPLLREGNPIGVIVLDRTAARPFTDKQIEFVEIFANQAVIAIENTRLLNELRESLAQQTATADVLKIISRSTFDLQVVLDTLAQSAVRLCLASRAVIFQRDGDLYRVAANCGYSQEAERYAVEHPLRAGRSSVTGRVALEGRAVHIPDVLADPEYTLMDYQKAFGYRTNLGVPLLRDGETIGVLTIQRDEVDPFTENQIELATTFANQAVIAIENSRLLNELRLRTDDLTESLEQQTATSNVLEIISRSAFDLEAVFETVVNNSVKLCEANRAIIYRFDGELLRFASAYNATAEFKHWIEQNPVGPGRHSAAARVSLERRIVHIPDVSLDPEYTYGGKSIEGVRTVLGVPIVKGDALLGCMVIYHTEVKPFTDKQIALVKTFADQAAIAIENVRLLDELRNSLEQQTATSEVLKVIASSTGELKPVFRAILENAVRICDAKFGNLFLGDEDGLRIGATAGAPEAYREFLESEGTFVPGPNVGVGKMVRTKERYQVNDLTAVPTHGDRLREITIKLAGARSLIGVPMLKDEKVIGGIIIYRQEVRPFNEKQIELVANFAAQAVIAIENARLLNELRQRTDDLTKSLEQQTATSELLRVISGSPTNAQPVFDMIAESAWRLCEAQYCFVYRFDGQLLHFIAHHGLTPEVLEMNQRTYPLPPSRKSAAARAVLERAVVQIPDVNADAEFILGSMASVGGFGSVVGVPILRDGIPVGSIAVTRVQTGLIPERQIELLKTFADQAVIAVDNVRLFKEVQERTDELSEALAQQTATADVLKIISRSAFDLKTVLTTLLQSAARLCEADQGTITQRKGDQFYRAVAFGYPQEFMDYVKDIPVELRRDTGTGRALLESSVVHIPDVEADPEYTWKVAQKLGGFRSMLGVPMLRDGEAIGVLTLTRKDVRPFSEKQIELVATFADQAAIAIENVRLFESVEARTRELGNSLEELRTAQDRLVQTEKLASLGQLTAGIAHEIKNPLNFVNNFSAISVELVDELRGALAGIKLDDKLRGELDEIEDTLKSNLEKIVQHGKRADSIVKNMLLHSRQGSGEHRPIDVNSVVEESLNLAYHGARAEKQGFNITLQRSFDPAAGEVDLYPQEFTRVLLNLISNGFYAATRRKAETNGGDYEPTLSAATKNLGDSVEIRIRDNGTGIPAEVKDKMFNPFFTTKPAGEGTGLGLSLSHDIIVKQHNGTIDVDTRPGEFTEFRIVLPRNAAAIGKTRGQA